LRVGKRRSHCPSDRRTRRSRSAAPRAAFSTLRTTVPAGDRVRTSNNPRRVEGGWHERSCINVDAIDGNPFTARDLGAHILGSLRRVRLEQQRAGRCPFQLRFSGCWDARAQAPRSSDRWLGVGISAL
jgi:hypothetical protein